jgi:hypothetical protein
METRKTLYFAMIHSHLVYCLSIYSCANMTSMNKLKLKQKEAIRLICNAGFREHTAPLFSQLKIHPIDQLINLSILKFMHSYAHNQLPFSFRNIWQTNRERFPDRELRNADKLFIPHHRFATLKRMPLFNFPYVWNSIGNEKNNPRLNQFISHMKKLLLQSLR